MSYRPRIRSLKPEIWRDQELQLLPVHARLLFIGLISNADDEGRLEGHPGLIRSTIFPADDDVTTKKVIQWLHILDERRFISLYESGDRPYIEISNWLKHQKIYKSTPSALPARNGNHLAAS